MHPALQGLIIIALGVGGCLGYFYFSNQLLDRFIFPPRLDDQGRDAWRCDLLQGESITPIAASDNHRVFTEEPGLPLHPALGSPRTSVFASAGDWPSIASVVGDALPARNNNLPPAVVLPERLIHRTGRIIPGQFGGQMGNRRDPWFIEASPFNAKSYGAYPDYEFHFVRGRCSEDGHSATLHRHVTELCLDLHRGSVHS